MRLFVFASLLAFLALSAVAGTPTAPQEQASELAMPEQSSFVTSAVVITHCNLVVGLVLVDNEGLTHPVHLEGRSRQDVQLILDSVPAANVVAVQVQCDGKAALP